MIVVAAGMIGLKRHHRVRERAQIDGLGIEAFVENLIAEIINGNQVKINKPGTVRIEAIQ